MRLKNLLEKVVDKANPEERTFPLIQSEMIIQGTPEIINELRDEERLYAMMQELQEKHDIRLYTPELTKHLRLFPMNRREVEVLGTGLNQLKRYYEKMKAEKAHVQLLSIGERGYIYVTKVGNEISVIKPLQDEKEYIIAPLAANPGPEIRDISNRWMAEEYIPGDCVLSTMPLEKAAELLGYTLGTIHRRGIVYNDEFTDHFLLAEKRSRIIDFGIAYQGNDFYEDVKNSEIYLGGQGRKHFEKGYLRSKS